MNEQPVFVDFNRSGVRRGREALRRMTALVLEGAMEELGWGENGSVGVVYCSGDAIRSLNRKFRDLDEPTDVLSFPAVEDLDEIRDEPSAYLGDLAVCIPYTAEHLAEGRSLEEEVALLLIHGLLHLLGWDHDTKASERRMWREQDRLLGLARQDGALDELLSSGLEVRA